MSPNGGAIHSGFNNIEGVENADFCLWNFIFFANVLLKSSKVQFNTRSEKVNSS